MRISRGQTHGCVSLSTLDGEYQVVVPPFLEPALELPLTICAILIYEDLSSPGTLQGIDYVERPGEPGIPEKIREKLQTGGEKKAHRISAPAEIPSTMGGR